MYSSSKIYSRFVFTHKFFRFLLIDRILDNKDNIVLITGKRGSGKTTLSIKQIMGFSDIEGNEEYYNQEKNISKDEKVVYKLENFTPFNMENHMCFSKKELQDLWKNEKMAFILADEAVVNANRRNSMTKANKILMEIVTINRKNYNTIFFCMPSIEDFDLAILQYITHWIHIDERKLAAVLLPNPPSLFGRKSWDIDHMKKIYEKFVESNPTAPSVPYWLFSNFRGYMKFSAMSKNVEDKYLEIATNKKNRDNEEEEKEVRPKRQLDEVKTKRIEEIVDKLIKGEIFTPEDLTAHSFGLGITDDKYKKEINKRLREIENPKTPTKIMKENRIIIKQEETDNRMGKLLD